MSRTPIILDGDPGHDDAIAWVFAAADPSLDIRAVISVAGNQTIEKTTWNARRIAALLGITAPVAMGANRPLTADPVTAGKWHGESGLDGPAMPLPDRPLDALPGVERMAQVLRESDGPVTIIATGPLTNVAQLLISCPHLKEKIGRISIMGGGEPVGCMLAALVFGFAQALGIKVSATGVDSNLVAPIPYVVTIISLVLFALGQRRKERKRYAAG